MNEFDHIVMLPDFHHRQYVAQNMCLKFQFKNYICTLELPLYKNWKSPTEEIT